MKFAERLSVYDYNIIYRPGKENQMPDLLSRALLAENQEGNKWDDKIKKAKKKNRLWVKPENWLQVLRDIHVRFGGHFCKHQMIQSARSRFYWHKLEQDIDQILKECTKCAEFSMSSRKYPLRHLDSSYPFEKVAFDTGHVTTSGNHKEYFFVAIDMFTKWIEVQTSNSETGTKIAQFMEKCVFL